MTIEFLFCSVARLQLHGCKTRRNGGSHGWHFILQVNKNINKQCFVYILSRQQSKQKRLLFSRSANDCQRFCDDARAFNCRSFAQKADRCYLSGDDSIALPEVTQPVDLGALYREKVCTRSKFFLSHIFFLYRNFDEESWFAGGFFSRKRKKISLR